MKCEHFAQIVAGSEPMPILVFIVGIVTLLQLTKKKITSKKKNPSIRWRKGQLIKYDVRATQKNRVTVIVKIEKHP